MTERTARILLVDDEQSIQELLSFPLRQDGYEVVQASDGREGLELFRESTFDLVVLDVMTVSYTHLTLPTIYSV